MAYRMLLGTVMSNFSRLSKQLWQLSMVSVMGLNIIGLDVDDGDEQVLFSSDLLLDMGAEELDYEDHRELFTGPAAMAEIAEQIEDWGESSSGPITAYIESSDSLRAELGIAMTAPFEEDPPSYPLWDESWETAASAESSFA